MNWGLGRGRRRERGQVVHCVRHSVQPDHGAQFAEVVSGMPRARQVGNDTIHTSVLLDYPLVTINACYKCSSIIFECGLINCI